MEINQRINEIRSFFYYHKEQFLNNLTPIQRTVATLALVIFFTLLACHTISKLKSFCILKPKLVPNAPLADIENLPNPNIKLKGHQEIEVHPKIENADQVNSKKKEIAHQEMSQEIPYITKEEYFQKAEATCKVIYQQPNLTEDEKEAQYNEYIEILDLLKQDPNRPPNKPIRSITDREYRDKTEFSTELIYKQAYLSDKEKSELWSKHVKILDAQKILSLVEIAERNSNVVFNFITPLRENPLQDREKLEGLPNEERAKEMQNCSDDTGDALLANHIKQKQLQTQIDEDDIYG